MHQGHTTLLKNRIGCPEKASKTIGFSADIELEEGLRRLIDWRSIHKAKFALKN